MLAERGVCTGSAQRYGLGSGYKRDIDGTWRIWFETREVAQVTAQALTGRLQDGWRVSIVEALRLAMQADFVDR